MNVMNSGSPLWETKDLITRFPGVLANNKVSIELFPGQIHGLLGENGCGKSTLIKTLAGVNHPESGEILYKGIPVKLTNPEVAKLAGVATVYQEFSLIPTLTVAENIFLDKLPTTRGKVNWQVMREKASDILNDMGIDIHCDTLISELSVAEQQLIEIAKVISTNANLIILDEPTAALGLDEIAYLHGLLRKLKESGKAILYVSHRLDEVVEIVDKITILKSGEVICRPEEAELSVDFIVNTMVGGDVKNHYPKENNMSEDVIFEAQGISAKNGIEDVSFKLRKGEVLGLGGVLGSGRTEIAHALFGVDEITQGLLILDDSPIMLRSPKEAIKHGIALIPENRKFDGLFFNFPGKKNLTISNLNGVLKRRLLDLQKEESLSQKFIEQLEVAKHASEVLIGTLSGGNQQKVIIARWLHAGSDIFIMDEPTQGIDVGAKVAVYNLINQLTKLGKAVIFISSDHDELLAMSDTIALVRHKTITGIKPVGQISKSDLVKSTDN